MTKTLAEIEADIAALQGQASTLREQAKAQARPRLTEIKTQVEALIKEALEIAKNNAIYDLEFVLEKGSGAYYGDTRLSYSYSEWSVSGPHAKTNDGWDSSSSNC